MQYQDGYQFRKLFASAVGQNFILRARFLGTAVQTFSCMYLFLYASVRSAATINMLLEERASFRCLNGWNPLNSRRDMNVLKQGILAFLRNLSDGSKK